MGLGSSAEAGARAFALKQGEVAGPIQSSRGFAFLTLIAKQDPGQGIVWLAFLSLLSGLLITFYLPRRRVWTRLSPDGELRICGRADRYVDFEREFGRLLGDLVAVRKGHGESPAV